MHARIVGDHVGNGFGLLVFNQFCGVADNVERHIHRVLLAEHSHAAAVSDLPVEKSRNQLIAARFELTGWSGLHHNGVFFGGFRREGGVRNRADSECQQRFI
ncbi:hypothetical protein D3C85_1333730 [compost metagenome]